MTIKNEQFRVTGNIGHARHRRKVKKKKIKKKKDEQHGSHQTAKWTSVLPKSKQHYLSIIRQVNLCSPEE